jgi:hypothetical protein
MTKPVYDCSFEPSGSWFVFDQRTGRTVKRGFPSKGRAVGWIADKQAEKPPAPAKAA